jgi:Bacterial regulatory proteins, tetR family
MKKFDLIMRIGGVLSLDADGLDLLSMRHVARTLHTSAASLYWHVGSKDGLLDLIFDRMIGEIPVPEPDPTIGRSSSSRSHAGNGRRSSGTATSPTSASSCSSTSSSTDSPSAPASEREAPTTRRRT